MSFLYVIYRILATAPISKDWCMSEFPNNPDWDDYPSRFFYIIMPTKSPILKGIRRMMIPRIRPDPAESH